MRRIMGHMFCTASAAMVGLAAFGQTPAQLPSASPSAGIQQIAPAPSRFNRAATPADEASVAPQPHARDIGKVNQLPSDVRASTDATDIAPQDKPAEATAACPSGGDIRDVASQLPPEAAGALNACSTLYWLESERARREHEAAADIATALAEEGNHQEGARRPTRQPSN